MSDPNFPPPPGGPPPPPGGGGYQPPPPPPPGGGGGFPPPPPGQPFQLMGGGPGGTTLAEGWKRILALFLDGLLINVVLAIPIAIVVGGSASGMNGFDASGILASAIVTVLGFLYYSLMIGMRGTTLAGMVLSLRVIDERGGAVTQEQAFKRSAWSLLSLVPCLGPIAVLILVIWGIVSLFTDDRRQVPWDKFAQTVVVDA